MNQEELQILYNWYNKNKREFLWRNTCNPYKIMVAEFMLHRTNANQVVPVYSEFIKRYPDIKSFKNANDINIRDITKHLGLHWRGKNFINAINFLINELNYIFPKNREELMKIPGIGEYIAGAILIICFNKSEYAVDSNIARFINRFYGFNLTGELRRKKIIMNKAKESFRQDDPKKFFFALLDFTSKVCKPNNPLCNSCILRNHCLSYTEKFQKIYVSPINTKIECNVSSNIKLDI